MTVAPIVAVPIGHASTTSGRHSGFPSPPHPNRASEAPAPEHGLFTASAALLIARVAFGVVGVGLSRRVGVLLAARFFLGLLLGMAWVHGLCHCGAPELRRTRLKWSPFQR